MRRFVAATLISALFVTACSNAGNSPGASTAASAGGGCKRGRLGRDEPRSIRRGKPGRLRFRLRVGRRRSKRERECRGVRRRHRRQR